MEELIKTLVNELIKRASKEVPDHGDFDTVEVLLPNTDKKLCVDTYALEFMQPPKGVENRETKRGLKIVGYNVGYKGEVGMEILKEVGTKDALIEKLSDELFIGELVECAFKLNDSLRDM